MAILIKFMLWHDYDEHFDDDYWKQDTQGTSDAMLWRILMIKTGWIQKMIYYHSNADGEQCVEASGFPSQGLR